MAEMLPLTTSALTFERGGRRLLDGLDLTLEAGRLTVIMGANGAGKSLLLRLLHGLIPASSGEVLWAGRRADAALRRRQAMVFQKPVLLRRSVAANIGFALKVRGNSGRSCAGLLEQAGLADRARQPARQLSGGEQQRLALARALAMEPEILFLDEPTASLDPAATLAIEQAVRTAHASGVKIVYVTHDIGQARRLADEIVFLHRGRLAEHSPAASFFDQPASGAAQAYLAGRLVP